MNRPDWSEHFFEPPGVGAEPFSESAVGIVDSMIAPGVRGRVRFKGTFWSAKLYQADQQVTLMPGELVNIIGRQGITLLVAPIT